MSALGYPEKRKLEALLGMSGGYVLGHKDWTFGEMFFDLVSIDIHSDKCCRGGTSKANKLRAFWEIEPDTMVGKVLQQLVRESGQSGDLQRECESIVHQLLGVWPTSGDLSRIATRFELRQQISRIEEAVESNPDHAIGMAKNFIETCCKRILEKGGVSLAKNPDINDLTKATFQHLQMTREDVTDEIEGADSIRKVISNLASISNEIARLRNLYAAHGKTADAPSLPPHYVALCVGSAATLVRCLFESHIAQERRIRHVDIAEKAAKK